MENKEIQSFNIGKVINRMNEAFQTVLVFIYTDVIPNLVDNKGVILPTENSSDEFQEALEKNGGCSYEK